MPYVNHHPTQAAYSSLLSNSPTSSVLTPHYGRSARYNSVAWILNTARIQTRAQGVKLTTWSESPTSINLIPTVPYAAVDPILMQESNAS